MVQELVYCIFGVFKNSIHYEYKILSFLCSFMKISSEFSKNNIENVHLNFKSGIIIVLKILKGILL